MIFITHQVPKGLRVDEVFEVGMGAKHNIKTDTVIKDM